MTHNISMVTIVTTHHGNHCNHGQPEVQLTKVYMLIFSPTISHMNHYGLYPLHTNGNLSHLRQHLLRYEIQFEELVETLGISCHAEKYGHMIHTLAVNEKHSLVFHHWWIEKTLFGAVFFIITLGPFSDLVGAFFGPCCAEIFTNVMIQNYK